MTDDFEQARRRGLTDRIARAEAETLKLARKVAPSARGASWASRESFSLAFVVRTDEEKARINDDVALLEKMRVAASNLGRAPDFISAESQETVDRRYGGDWNYVWR